MKNSLKRHLLNCVPALVLLSFSCHTPANSDQKQLSDTPTSVSAPLPNASSGNSASSTMKDLPADTMKESPPGKIASQSDNTYAKANLTFRIIPSPENTFGYDIYLDERIMIHQPSIPGLPGNKGFAKKEQASTVANLVIGKIRNGEMPPTVTTEELKKLGVKTD